MTVLLPDADEYTAIRAAARAAEDVDNLSGALRLVRLLPDDLQRRRWLRSLDEGLRVVDDAARARWRLQPALRYAAGSGSWMRLLTVAADVLRARGLAAVMGEQGTADCAQDDPLVVDAGLFDLGMLQAYLDTVLAPGRHETVALLAEWVGRPVSAHEVLAVQGDQATVRDLVTGAEADVAGARGRMPGALLYGRVVPVPGAARFVLPPVELDRIAARRVARAVVRRAPVGERLRAVASYQRRSTAS